MSGDGEKQNIVRKELLSAALASGFAVSRVDIRQIDFAPGQQTGRHLHPCPVVGYIARGTAHFQIADQPGETLREGDAFYEPAGTTILHFDNASEREPLTFIAFYLLGAGEHELIGMLE